MILPRVDLWHLLRHRSILFYFLEENLTFKAIRRKDGIALKEYDTTSNITENTTEDIINENKRLLGQFFTITNPFSTNIFYKWMGLIPDNSNSF